MGPNYYLRFLHWNDTANIHVRNDRTSQLFIALLHSIFREDIALDSGPRGFAQVVLPDKAKDDLPRRLHVPPNRERPSSE